MGTTANVNMLTGVKFTLLGAELSAGFEKNETGQHIFINQSLDGDNEGITIGKLVSDIKTLMGKKPAQTVEGFSEDDIKGKLKAVSDKNSTFDFNAVRIKLQTVYLDIKKPTTGASTVEYAFRLDIIAEGLIPADVKLINIERITLAIWNTENNAVKKQMAITSDVT